MNTKITLVSLLCICCSIIIITQQQCPDMHHKPSECPTANQPSVASPPSSHTPTEQTDVHISPIVRETNISRTITVTNKITQKMLAYTKGFMQYTPEFVLSVNNMPVEQGKQQQIVIENNYVTVGYTYNFMNGYKKGSKEIEFMVPTTKDELDITFSWQDDWRIVISGAQPHKIISEVS